MEDSKFSLSRSLPHHFLPHTFRTIFFTKLSSKNKNERAFASNSRHCLRNPLSPFLSAGEARCKTFWSLLDVFQKDMSAAGNYTLAFSKGAFQNRDRVSDDTWPVFKQFFFPQYKSLDHKASLLEAAISSSAEVPPHRRRRPPAATPLPPPRRRRCKH